MADLIMDREFGTAYGFVGLEELGRYRISQIDNGQAIVRDAIERTIAYSNARNETWRSQLSMDTLLATEHYENPSGGTLQDLDEHGVPLPTVQLEGYDVAYPIRGGGDATGTDRVSRALQTVAEANRAVQQATLRDKKWHLNYMLASILRNTSYSFLDRGRRTLPGAGNLTVQPLANGDATQYIKNQGGSVGTDDHYLAQAAAISDAANPFPAIYDDLVEHADSDTEVTVYVAKNLVASIEALTNFREPRDPNIQYGSGESTVARGEKGIGDRYIGYVDGCHIVQLTILPDNYMFAQLPGRKPLAYRQYPAASLQGLFQETYSPDGNHLQTSFLRFGGYGVRVRDAALVYFIGNASYTAPTSLPMKLS